LCRVVKFSTCATTTGVRPTPISSVVSSSSGDSSCGFMRSLSRAPVGSDSQRRVMLTILSVFLVDVKYFALQSYMRTTCGDLRIDAVVPLLASRWRTPMVSEFPVPHGRSCGRDYSREVLAWVIRCCRRRRTGRVWQPSDSFGNIVAGAFMYARVNFSTTTVPWHGITG